MNRLKCMYPDKESFHEWIMACCDTFLRNEDNIYSLVKDHTSSIDVIFPARVGETAKMLLEIEKVVQNNEEKFVVIQSLDKENDKNENKNDNE